MLGEQIGEVTGQITGTRVLPDQGAGPMVEVSWQTSGTLLGAHIVSALATSVSVTRPDGTLFGDGQGIAWTDQGEVVTWRGQGVGHFTGHGTAQSWRGALYYQATSQRLAQLNGIAGVYEFEIDQNGKTTDKVLRVEVGSSP